MVPEVYDHVLYRLLSELLSVGKYLPGLDFMVVFWTFLEAAVLEPQ